MNSYIKCKETLIATCDSASVIVGVWDASALVQSTLRLEARCSTSKPRLAERRREDSSQAWLAMKLHLNEGNSIR